MYWKLIIKAAAECMDAMSKASLQVEYTMGKPGGSIFGGSHLCGAPSIQRTCFGDYDSESWNMPCQSRDLQVQSQHFLELLVVLDIAITRL
jgi:hypothetical protein